MTSSEKIVEAIRTCFYSRSLALVGASDDPRKYGYMTLRSILEAGYTGEVYPINPKGGEIMGVKVYPSLQEIPGTLDLAVIVVPAQFVSGILREAAAKGAKGAVILSGGFREAGRPDLEKEVTQVGRELGVRIMGPNIQGINYLSNKLCAMFFPVITRKGPLAIVSQSGTITAALAEWSADEGLGISAAVNLGNQVDLCESDYIEFFAEDDSTRAIVLYLEGIKDGHRFLEVIRRVPRRKPMAILKGGQTIMGQKSAASHTGSLAGRYEVFHAACRQNGVYSASDLPGLYDAAKALATLRPPRGNRVMMITTSGGAGVLASDVVDAKGLVFPPLPAELVEDLKANHMPPLAVFSNPLDLVSIQAEYFERAVLAADRQDVADVFLLGFGDPVAEGVEMVKRLSSQIHGGLAVAYLGGGAEEKIGRVRLHEAGIPVFPTPERAIRAISAVVQYSLFRGKP